MKYKKLSDISYGYNMLSQSFKEDLIECLKNNSYLQILNEQYYDKFYIGIAPIKYPYLAYSSKSKSFTYLWELNDREVYGDSYIKLENKSSLDVLRFKLSKADPQCLEEVEKIIEDKKKEFNESISNNVLKIRGNSGGHKLLEQPKP